MTEIRRSRTGRPRVSRGPLPCKALRGTTTSGSAMIYMGNYHWAAANANATRQGRRIRPDMGALGGLGKRRLRGEAGQGKRPGTRATAGEASGGYVAERGAQQLPVELTSDGGG